MSDDLFTLPPDLPAPEDDGACDHLRRHARSVTDPGVVAGVRESRGIRGRSRRALRLSADGGAGPARCGGLGCIPGARGCTPQSCGFRDHVDELEQLGARVAGLSAQTLAEQEEVAGRLHLPYPVIADPGLRLGPRARFADVHVRGRGALQAGDARSSAEGVVEHVFYPVFPPDRNAAAVVAWLRAAARERSRRLARAASGSTRTSSTSRSRRCARATTPTPTSTTRGQRCSRTGSAPAS